MGSLKDQCGAAIDFARHIEHGLKDRLGPFFLQLPPAYTAAKGGDLSRFLNHWKRECGLPISVEVRHLSWYEDHFHQRLDRMLNLLGHGRVILDTRPVYEGPVGGQDASVNKKPKVPIVESCTNQYAFVRLICHPQADVNEPYFHYWAVRVLDWMKQGKRVFFFLHCPQEAHSVHYARRFQELLEGLEPSVPSLPWNDIPKWGLFD